MIKNAKPHQMSALYKDSENEVPKAPTGIEGFDQITRGGLPRGSVTLVTGGSGSGKTVFGFQTLVNGASLFGEPGLFVAFEERSKKLAAHAAAFGWSMTGWEILDAMPPPDLVAVGDFDLAGTLAILSAKVHAMKARRVVFDSIDVLFQLLPGVQERRRELNRLHSWLLDEELTAIITAKLDWVETAKPAPLEDEAMRYLPYIVDCVVALTKQYDNGFSQRRVRVVKYRGSGFVENDTPFVISPSGLQVAVTDPPTKFLPLTGEKISTGILALDEMLYGGFLRGTTTMITGNPGTAKTTLSGAFAEEAARRGEKTVYVAFDESAEEIVRNLTSVNIHLQEHIDKGILRMHSENVGFGGTEEHFHSIKKFVESHQATCLVIDPFTAFSSSGSLASTQAVASRMVRWVKSQGITLVCTSLPMAGETGFSGTILKITTVADTWIYLNFFDGGERNRGLTILKSRGTNHSNQVRELLLSSSGISIAAPYTADGTVLMGTMRWQKELAEKEQKVFLDTEFERKTAASDVEIAELHDRLESLKRRIAEKQLAKSVSVEEEQTRKRGEGLRQSSMTRLRQSEEVGSTEDRHCTD
jgi:circadian clock protein KaiC